MIAGTPIAPVAMQAMAALEAWAAADDSSDRRRTVAFEHVGFGAERPWRVVVSLGTRVTEHSGMTLADALAQAAQVVLADPDHVGGPAS